MKSLTTKKLLEFAGVDTTKGAAKALVQKYLNEDMEGIEPEKPEHGKERGEFDAVSMTKNQLQTIIRDAKEMQDSIHDDEEIPEWIKAKITKAQDYIQTVADVMLSRHEDGQAVHDDRGSDEEDCSDMAGPMMGGMEQEEWAVKHTGENTKQSVATLRHQAAAAKKAGDIHRYHQKEFAVQAKTHWGK
jgi:hypothetical protein